MTKSKYVPLGKIEKENHVIISVIFLSKTLSLNLVIRKYQAEPVGCKMAIPLSAKEIKVKESLRYDSD